jgi:hypothetical protein
MDPPRETGYREAMTSSAAGANVSGKFEQVSTENYDEYLKASGMGMVQRTLMLKAKETITLAIAGQQGEITVSSPLKTLTHRFSLGQEFAEDSPDGRHARSVIVMEGNKLIHIQRFEGSECVTIREVGASEMKTTYSTEGVTAVRTYKRIA